MSTICTASRNTNGQCLNPIYENALQEEEDRHFALDIKRERLPL